MIIFQIEEKKYCLEQYDEIEEIWLFGSYARGEQDQYSDIDLLIVIRDCTEGEYKRLKQELSQKIGIPLEWISLYEVHKIREMGEGGSYFLWHLKKEGQILFSKNNFLQHILNVLPTYRNSWQDLDDYSEICDDIQRSLEGQYLDATYELSVLASLIRNTAMTIDFLLGEKVFGRIEAVEACNRLLTGRFNISIDQYKKLYMNRLYITGKACIHTQANSNDVREWLTVTRNLILCAREVYNENSDDSNMGRINENEQS